MKYLMATLQIVFEIFSSETVLCTVDTVESFWHFHFESLNIVCRNGVGFNISFNILFGMAFLASSFVIFLVQERASKAKHIQFVSGVGPFCYWSSTLVWDMINFVFPVILIVIIFVFLFIVSVEY